MKKFLKLSLFFGISLSAFSAFAEPKTIVLKCALTHIFERYVDGATKNSNFEMDLKIIQDGKHLSIITDSSSGGFLATYLYFSTTGIAQSSSSPNGSTHKIKITADSSSDSQWSYFFDRLSPDNRIDEKIDFSLNRYTGSLSIRSTSDSLKASGISYGSCQLFDKKKF